MLLLLFLDLDECRLQPGLCRNGTCENTVGGHQCHCHPGFKLSDNGDCEGRLLGYGYNVS